MKQLTEQEIQRVPQFRGEPTSAELNDLSRALLAAQAVIVDLNDRVNALENAQSKPKTTAAKGSASK